MMLLQAKTRSSPNTRSQMKSSKLAAGLAAAVLAAGTVLAGPIPALAAKAPLSIADQGYFPQGVWRSPPMAPLIPPTSGRRPAPGRRPTSITPTSTTRCRRRRRDSPSSFGTAAASPGWAGWPRRTQERAGRICFCGTATRSTSSMRPTGARQVPLPVPAPSPPRRWISGGTRSFASAAGRAELPWSTQVPRFPMPPPPSTSSSAR